MLKAHVAAGLDAGLFWRLTPREWLVHLQGARDRMAAVQASSAIATRAATHCDAGEFEAWLASTTQQSRPPLTPEAVDRMLTHTAVGLPVITMEEYRDMKGDGR